jgi:hypothetical protein
MLECVKAGLRRDCRNRQRSTDTADRRPLPRRAALLMVADDPQGHEGATSLLVEMRASGP